jgi:ATPase, P-type (transporting), HAD superfamily, subfamily IC/heavy metal translocating P-type ATPase
MTTMTAGNCGCWHCGEPLQAGDDIHAHIAGKSRAMCCDGCRAAAEWIEQLGLADYYRLRTQLSQKPSVATVSVTADPWSRPENARHVVRDVGQEQREVLLSISGVRCSACVWLIERALGAMPGVVSVQVNAMSRRARIVWRDADTTLSELLQILMRTGYSALPLDARGLDDIRRSESRDALKRLLLAGFGMMQAMMYATAVYVAGIESLDPSTHQLLRWLQLLVATPVVFYSARPFFTGAVRSLKLRQLGMDVPVAAAIAAVYAASLIETLRGTGEVYFDSISMFVFLLLAGRYLEMRARHRAGDLTDALARLTPPFADRCLEDGRLERVGVHELRVGDRVHIWEGSIVPADGALLSERCRVDEALLSGESAAVMKKRGDRLIAGSVLEDGPVQLRVEGVGTDTVLAGISALANRAQTQRPKLQRAGDQTTARLVARVLALTAVTIVGWCIVDPSRAFPAAVAVLVVSCPCAFALAVSAAITRALAVLAHRGVLVAKPDAIQALAECTDVVFDKTGTLTQSVLALADVETFNHPSMDDAPRLAAVLARASRHPIARAIAAALPDRCRPNVRDLTTHAGLGISASLDGRELRLGRSDFASPDRRLAPDNDDVVLLADDAGAIAAFRLHEQLRPGAEAAMEALRKQGLAIHIASGDSAVRVSRIAARLRIADWRARLLPAHKLAWLTELRARGARVLAVGDGVNDAPVLAGAHVSIAMADGADLAHASSDIVLAEGRLEAIGSARAIAQQTLAIVHQNQRWALFYNLTVVPLAAFGLVPPWLAAIGMSLSSLGVVLNALRIGGKDARRGTPRLAPMPASVPARAQSA